MSMFKSGKHKKRKSGERTEDSRESKKENIPLILPIQDNDPVSNEKDYSELQKKALFSALGIETRTEAGEESFDEDASDDEDDD